MNELSTTEARLNFSEMINQVAYGKVRTVLNRRGKGLVALIPIEDLRHLEMLENKIDLEDAKSILKRGKRGRSWKAIKEEAGI